MHEYLIWESRQSCSGVSSRGGRLSGPLTRNDGLTRQREETSLHVDSTTVSAKMQANGQVASAPEEGVDTDRDHRRDRCCRGDPPGYGLDRARAGPAGGEQCPNDPSM